jgi:hypothetical protein
MVAGAAICVFLAGCGGGDDELSKAEFVTQADAICRKAQDKLSKVEKNYASGIVDLLNSEADEIEALDGPSGDADEIEAIVASTRKAAEAVEANKTDLAKAEATAEKAEKLADDYGLKDCLMS